jgi:5,10-methenyltetrahydromethanopterin hydrogenase
MDILAALMTLHYSHRHYQPDVLNKLLLSTQTLEMIRKKIKINTKLFNKLYKSLEEKNLIGIYGLHPTLIKYPKNGKFKLYITFEVEK